MAGYSNSGSDSAVKYYEEERDPEKCAWATDEEIRLNAELTTIKSTLSDLNAMLNSIKDFQGDGSFSELKTVCEKIIITGEKFDKGVTNDISSCLENLKGLFTQCNNFLVNEEEAKTAELDKVKEEKDYQCEVIKKPIEKKG